MNNIRSAEMSSWIASILRVWTTRTGSAGLVAAIMLLGGSGIAKAQWATSSNDVYNTNVGNVGIGTAGPGAKLDIFSGVGQLKLLTLSTNPAVDWRSTSSGVANNPARLNVERSRSGGSVAAGDTLLDLAVYGHDGTDYNTGVMAIRVAVDGAVFPNRVPGRITFATAAGASGDDLA